MNHLMISLHANGLHPLDMKHLTQKLRTTCHDRNVGNAKQRPEDRKNLNLKTVNCT